MQYLDESKKEVFLGFDDSLGKFNDVAERIVYIIENRLGGISAIDNLDVRDFYQSFTYKTNLCVSDDFCVLNSVLFFYNSLEWELKKFSALRSRFIHTKSETLCYCPWLLGGGCL